MPALFKMLYGMIVDCKIVSKRKFYLIGFGIISALSQFLVASDVLDKSDTVVRI